MRDIAREAGITDAAIYYHFSDKCDLLHALMEDELHQPPAPGITAAETPHELSAISQTVARRALSLIGSNAPLLRIVLHEALAGDSQAIRRYHEWLSFWEDRLGNMLAQFEQDGVLSAGEAKDIAREMISTLVFASEDALLLRPLTAESREQRRARLEAFLSSALARIAGSHALVEPQPALHA